MGIIVIQLYILVSKLKKTKTRLLRYTDYYLNSIKTYKASFIANSTTRKLSKLLTSCLTAVTYY